jgi:hypothetical protein
VAAIFSQRYCAVARATSGGNLKKGAGYFPCTVEVTGYAVSLTSGATRIDHAQPAAVQIITPGWQRRVGAGTIIAMNGEQWSIDFGRVYQQERIEAGKQGFFRTLFGTGAPRKSLHRARELNESFTAALLEAGASDQRADKAG